MIEIAEKCDTLKQKEVESHKLDINNEISRISQGAENGLKSLGVKPDDIKQFMEDFQTNLNQIKKGLITKVDALGCGNINPLEVKQNISSKQSELKKLDKEIEDESAKYIPALVEKMQKEMPGTNNYLLLQTVGKELKNIPELSGMYAKADTLRSEINSLNSKLKGAESFAEDKKIFINQMLELSTLFGDRNKLDDLIDIDGDNGLFTRGLNAVTLGLYGVDKTGVDISDGTKRKSLISDIINGIDKNGGVENFLGSLNTKESDHNNPRLSLDPKTLLNPTEGDIKGTLNNAYETRDNQINGNSSASQVDLGTAQDSFNKAGFGSQFKEAIDGFTKSRDNRYNEIDQVVNKATKGK